MKISLILLWIVCILSCTKKKQVIIIPDTSFTKVSSTILFNNSLKYENVLDHEGTSYRTILIGNQIWMAENLRVVTFRNGDSIPTTTPYNQDISSNSNAIYQWVYNGNSIFIPNYGRLYTWNVVKDTRGVCPVGWKVPSDQDWAELVQYVGGESVAGGNLKETDTIHWYPPNSYATNKFGFTGLPGYYRNDKLKRHTIGHEGYWWTATNYDTTTAYCYGLSNESNYIDYTQFPKNRGLSIRCIKNN
jgi:uncharacterized protein (TIGR02145 family)